MKSICKLTLTTVIFTLIFTTVGLKAQELENSDIGLTVGLDYSSNYFYRGMYSSVGNQYNGGMISPYVSYDIFNTGLSVGIKGEIIEMWFWGSKDEGREMQMSDFVNSIDYNINYMYNIKEIVTFNFGIWYYHHKSWHDGSSSLNTSYCDIQFLTMIEALPLNPMFAITYSHFMDENYYNYDGKCKNGDIYIQFGIGHSFQIVDKTFLEFDAVAGLFKKNAYDFRMNEARKPFDISDIDLSAGITTKSGLLTLSSSFHYILTPGTQYKYTTVDHGVTKDIHKFYVQFGVACSI